MDTDAEKKEKALQTATRLVELLGQEEVKDVGSHEEKIDNLVLKLKEITQNRHCSDYIFWSNEFNREDEPYDVKGLIERCFRDRPKPIAL